MLKYYNMLVKCQLLPVYIGLTGALLVASSFFIDKVLGFHPCQMCLWQRYLHMAIAVVGVGGGLLVLRHMVPPRAVLAVLLLLALAGGGVGFWQAGGEWKLWQLPAVCHGDSSKPLAQTPEELLAALQNYTPAPACDEPALVIFGLSLAGWNMVIMALLAGLILAALFAPPRKK